MVPKSGSGASKGNPQGKQRFQAVLTGSCCAQAAQSAGQMYQSKAGQAGTSLEMTLWP